MDNSPFGRLSAELRNRIYELVLVHKSVIPLENSFRANNLARTCHQMRCETTVMFWASNRFLICLYSRRYNFDLDANHAQNISIAVKVGRFPILLGKDIVSSIMSLHIIPVAKVNRLEIYGAQDGKVNLSDTRSSWDNEVTDVTSADLWVSEHRPIVQALLDLGLEVREIRGLNEEQRGR